MPPDAIAKASDALTDAIDKEENVLFSMRYPELQKQFYASILEQTVELEDMICRLLQVQTCKIHRQPKAWRHGSFNVAIIVWLPSGKTAYLRLPFSHRIGERPFPGNLDEKIRTETATYLWLQEHCPDVPIPTLYAFGLPDGSIHTRPQNTTWWRRAWTGLRRFFACLLGYPAPIQYSRHATRHSLASGFLLMSEAEGESLALSWPKYCHDKSRRENLFRGLARISLSMNSIPQPRLGSFSFQDGNSNSISLCNRPLNLYMHMLENEGIFSGIPRGRTYAEVESYISDLLSLQDFKLRKQPNAIFDEEDGQRQLAASAGMRAIMHHFINPDTRQGPFYVTLNDLSQNNIHVDEQWNVRCIIDLEWTHTLPAEMQAPPYWLTSKSVDGFDDRDDLEEYEQVLTEYISIYSEEEIQRNGLNKQAAIQLKSWENGGFWYFKAATIPKGAYNIFNCNIQPIFNKDHPNQSIFDKVFFFYWGQQASSFVEKKVNERNDYIKDLKEAFAQDELCYNRK
ncbi:hypothetical protein ARSEF4850_005792 [Beauveria asiatica]